MKKAILATLMMMTAQTTFAADVYCGASVESKPGSQQYDKPVFYEKADVNGKQKMYFLLKDGSVITSETLTPEILQKITTGTRVLSVSFTNGKSSLFSARIKRTEKKGIEYKNMAMAIPMNGTTGILIANDVSLFCMER